MTLDIDRQHDHSTWVQGAVSGTGSISMLGMSEEEERQAARRKKKIPFGFALPPPKKSRKK